MVQHFLRNNFHLDEITLAPLADSGFTANRVTLCQHLNPTAANNTFCPDPNATDPNDPVIAQAVAGVFPNQLKSALACNGLLYLPNVGAQPEPPVAAGVNLNTNVQALVHVVDIASLAEREDLTVNLNSRSPLSRTPDPAAGSLAHLFGNDIVAMDADDDCENFFILSRGGNYVLKAQLGADGKLDIGAPNNVRPLPDGQHPDGYRGGRRG